jgi:hypothetical protein
MRVRPGFSGFRYSTAISVSSSTSMVSAGLAPLPNIRLYPHMLTNVVELERGLKRNGLH